MQIEEEPEVIETYEFDKFFNPPYWIELYDKFKQIN